MFRILKMYLHVWNPEMKMTVPGGNAGYPWMKMTRWIAAGGRSKLDVKGAHEDWGLWKKNEIQSNALSLQ